MQIELKTDASCIEPKIIILTASVTEEVNKIMKKLTEESTLIITGSRNSRIEILEQAEIIRIYSANAKVFAVTDNGEYVLRMRLYEAEEKLNSERFVRISNSELINIKKAVSFDCSITGTICVRLKNGQNAYVSRRYVSKIKKMLGL